MPGMALPQVHPAAGQPEFSHHALGGVVLVGIQGCLVSTAGGTGGTQILLQATGVERQPLFRVVVPHGEIPAGLPKPSIHQQGGRLSVGGIVCRLVQPSAPPQRHQVRDAPSTPQR